MTAFLVAVVYTYLVFAVGVRVGQWTRRGLHHVPPPRSLR